jgi:hypothetical protein
MSILFAQLESYYIDWERIWNWLSINLLNIVGAVAVLIVGWIVALVVSLVIRALLRRTTVDERLARSMAEENQPPPDLSGIISKLAFWLIMLVVLVAFFQTLGLTAVTEPLNRFLDQVFLHAPRVLAAALLIFVAWVVATVLRLLVRKTLTAVNFDERLSRQAEPPKPEEAELTGDVIETPSETAGTSRRRGRRRAEEAAETTTETPPVQPMPLTRAISEATYWLVWLLFIPAILDTLGTAGLLAPVQGLVNQILGFLPNLLAAALILLIGWFVARVVQRVVTNLLAALGTDQLSARLGVAQIIGNYRLSQVLGVVVYVFIFIPVLVAALDALQIQAVTAPVSLMLTEILDALPNIFAAILVVVLAYVVGRLVSGLVTQLLERIGFDRVPVLLGLTSKTPRQDAQKPSYIAGMVVMVAILLVSTMQALRLLNFEMVELLLAGFLVFAGNVLLGVVIFGFGLYAARFVGDLVLDSDVNNALLLSRFARAGILVLAGAMALQQMGLAPDIINLAFGLTLGAIAVAAAIAFGIGGREAAREVINDFLAEQRNGADTGNGKTAARRRGRAKEKEAEEV